MFFEVLSLTYHSPITIESLTYGVLRGTLQSSSVLCHSFSGQFKLAIPLYVRARRVRARGGFLTLDDLARARAEWYEPIAIDYRGARVLTSSPPANSFDALVRLCMMSRFALQRGIQAAIAAPRISFGSWM